MNEPNKNHLLTRIEAAKYLGVSSITLGLWKSTKRYDLPVVKVGRLAKYRYGLAPISLQKPIEILAPY